MKKLLIATALTLAAVSAMPANAGAATRSSQTCWVSDGFSGYYARCRGTMVSHSQTRGRKVIVRLPPREPTPVPRSVNFRPDNAESVGGAGGGGGGGGGGR